MKRIIYTRLDGGVSIIIPSPEFLSKFATEKEALSAIRAKALPAEAKNVREVAESVIAKTTSNRVFRDAWKQKGSSISVNMPKARDIKTERVRLERNSKLSDLDVDYMRADEAGDKAKKGRIARKKQELRDLPSTIQSELDAIATPEELEKWKPTWPA